MIVSPGTGFMKIDKENYKPENREDTECEEAPEKKESKSKKKTAAEYFARPINSKVDNMVS